MTQQRVAEELFSQDERCVRKLHERVQKLWKKKLEKIEKWFVTEGNR